MPPFSGFLGKIMILQASIDAPQQVLIWAVILVTSLVAIVGFGRAGSLIFWKSYDATIAVPDTEEGDGSETVSEDAEDNRLIFVPVFCLLSGLVALTLFAGPALNYAQATADQLFNSEPYRDAVLGRIAK